MSDTGKVRLVRIACEEGISKKSLYNIVSAMRGCHPKIWNGWVFVKEGKYWYGKKEDRPSV